jgi:hypothetical protein
VRWYYAESEDAERWTYGGDSMEAAADHAIKVDCWDPPFCVAPEVEATDPRFFAALAAAIAWGFESADEWMSEEGWMDYEEPYLGGTPLGKELERKLAEWLPTVLERPDWRTVDTAKAETIDPEELETRA